MPGGQQDKHVPEGCAAALGKLQGGCPVSKEDCAAQARQVDAGPTCLQC